jgi:hypothetical protein
VRGGGAKDQECHQCLRVDQDHLKLPLLPGS